MKSMKQMNLAAAESKISEKKSIPWWQTERAKIVGAIVGGILFLGFIIWVIAFMPYVSTDDAMVDGTIVRCANTGLSGQIIKIYVKEGDHVTKDQLLLEIDHAPAEAALQRMKARAEYAVQESKRIQILANQQGTSRHELERINSEAEIAEADLKTAEINLDHTYIKSPIDGVVIQKSTEEGNILEVNQTAIIIADIDNDWVTANIEENHIKSVKPGQKVKISIDEGGSVTGTVFEVRKAAASTFALIPQDNSSGNFIKVVQRIPVKILVDPHPGKILRIGQSVEVRIKVI